MAENGRLPDSDLVTTYLYYPGTVNGRQLHKDAAASAEAMATAFALEFNEPLYAVSGYRSYEDQVRVREEKGPAWTADPGTSNHGWGKALDIGSGANDFDSDTFAWLKENADRFGWEHPVWARRGGGREEPWHWEWQGGGSEHPRIRRPQRGEIGLGSKGDKVKRIQMLVNQRLRGKNLEPDGDYGLRTAIAVARFQDRAGMAISGVVGGVTLARLKGKEPEPEEPKAQVIYLQMGTRKADQVEKLQRWLNATLGTSLTVDGHFGEFTKIAVQVFQGKNRLTRSGKIGPITLAAMKEKGLKI